MEKLQDAFDSVKLVIAKLGVEPSEITQDCNLQRDLGLDSLDLADLVFQMEIAFNIRITDSDLEHMTTVQDIVTYLDNKVQFNGIAQLK